MINGRKFWALITFLGACASTPTPPAPPAKVCRFPLDLSQKFELQQEADDYLDPVLHACGKIGAPCPWPMPIFVYGYDVVIEPEEESHPEAVIEPEEVFSRVEDPEGRSEDYITRFWNSPERMVFGLDGPFRLENGKIPVFVCDTTRRQYIRFGPSYLYCPDMAGGPITVRLSEDHPHPDGRELAPGNMPKNRVLTKMYLWRDGCIDEVATNWVTTAYCVPEGTGRPTIWCEPYKP